MKRNNIRFLQRNSQSFVKNIKIFEYNTVNARLSNSQLNKLKSAFKNIQGIILRMNARILSANNLPRELLLTIR